MKSAIILVFIWYICICNGQNVQLNVKIGNIRHTQGNLKIAVYNNRKDFPEIGKEHSDFVIPVSDSILTYPILLTSGTYAIALFHDVNGDGICNRNKLGIPTEPYGFSNNIHPRIPILSYKRASFELNSSSSIIINLIHPKNRNK